MNVARDFSDSSSSSSSSSSSPSSSSSSSSSSACRHRIRLLYARHSLFSNTLCCRHFREPRSRYACARNAFSLFSISKYLWQRIINLLPKRILVYIEINKFNINHLFSVRASVCYWSDIVRMEWCWHKVCDDGKYCVSNGVNGPRQHHINVFLLFSAFIRLLVWVWMWVLCAVCWVPNTTTSITNGCSVFFGRSDLDTPKDTNEWIVASQAVHNDIKRHNGKKGKKYRWNEIESDYIAYAFGTSQHRMDSLYIDINRKMDGHNRKRKDVIYFYYRRTAFDRFVVDSGTMRERERLWVWSGRERERELQEWVGEASRVMGREYVQNALQSILCSLMFANVRTRAPGAHK